jgi:hypothetical protein
VALFERDTIGQEAVFLQKKHTDRVLSYLEALATLVSSPPGLAKVTATENNALLDLTGLVSFILGAIPPSPFNVVPKPSTGGVGWVVVSSFSFLLWKTYDPTSTIVITGLNTPIQLAAGDALWLDIDTTNLFALAVSAPTASIGHGPKWAPSFTGVFPTTYAFDTDNGKPGGTDTGAQKHLYVPIGYCAVNTDPIAGPFGIPLGGTYNFVRVLTNHLVLVSDCYAGNAPFAAQPWYGALPAVT